MAAAMCKLAMVVTVMLLLLRGCGVVPFLWLLFVVTTLTQKVRQQDHQIEEKYSFHAPGEKDGTNDSKRYLLTHVTILLAFLYLNIVKESTWRKIDEQLIFGWS
jgi:hypothetical protein